jgi:cytoskeletal protein RodZ
MHQYWKMTKLILVFALAFSLFGCGISDKTKVETQKVEQTKEQSKEETKKENKKTEEEPIVTNPEANPNVVANENTEMATEKPETQPKETTTITTKNKPSNPTTTASPAAPSSTPTPTPPPPVVPKSSATIISIEGPDGTIVGAKKVNFEEGATVLDVLIQLTGKNNIDYSGNGDTAYVHGLYNVYEFDHGPTSGWTYKYNGVIVSKSAGAVKVKDGDSITWIYKKS